MKVFQSEDETKHIRLDLRDKKILQLLAQNSRLSFSSIAREVKLSRDAVKYRIDRMVENKVIQGFRTIVNVNKLGYFSYHVFLELHHTRENERKLVEFFIGNDNINAVLKYSGKWDFEVAFMAENPSTFDKFLTTVIEKAGIVQDYEILILLETFKSAALPGKFVQGHDGGRLEWIKSDSSFAKEFERGNSASVEIDEQDFEILKILAEDARISILELGKKVGLSDDAVSYRIRNLIKGGVIVAFRPVVNFSALGFSVYAVLFKLQNISEEKELKFKNFLKNHANVLWAVKTIGRINVLAYVIADSQLAFHETMAEIKTKFGEVVQNYESLFAYQELKYTYIPTGLKLKN